MHPATQCRIIAASPAVLLLLLSMLVPLPSHAAALGDELILSQLGDPVEVEIAVMQWDDIDLDQVQISAGTPEVYESFGLDYLPALESFNFNLIGPNLNGEVKILVSSREPLQEPYLELLLLVRWPGGSLLREYVLLFDPPRTTPPAGAPASSAVPAVTPQPQIAAQPEAVPDIPTATRQNQAVAVEVESPQPAAAAEEARAQSAPTLAEETTTVTVREIDEPVPASEVDGAVTVVEIEEDVPISNETSAQAREVDTYTVESGDNLWGIASRFGPPDTDIYQILLGIYELNRGSFINGNISLLKYGVTLRLPTRDDIAGIDPATAKSLFDQRWEEGSERIAMAERGEPLPPFSSIFAPEIVRPEFNPTAPFPESQGQLSPGAAGGGGQGLASSTGAVVPQTAVSPAGAPGAAGQPSVLAPAVNGAGVPVPQAGTPTATPNAAGSGNAYLDSIDNSLQLMREMLEAKQQQVELLEAQMSEMSARMLEVTRVTERLNNSLDDALRQRERQQEIDRRNIFLLGGLVVVLSIAVVAIVMMVLKLAAQIRLQHELLQSSMQSRALATANASGIKREPPKPLAEGAKSGRAQKYLPPEQAALSVSIIEEEEELPDTNPSSAADVNGGSNASKDEMDVQLGDMDLDQSEAHLPESR